MEGLSHFMYIYNDFFKGIIKEDDYIHFVSTLSGNWFALDFNQDELGIQIINDSQLHELMNDLYKLVKEKKITHVTHPYTYVHQPDNPQMIKLYDPRKGGSSCSIQSPDPWWVFSTMEPTIDDLSILKPPKRKLSKMFSKWFFL